MSVLDRWSRKRGVAPVAAVFVTRNLRDLGLSSLYAEIDRSFRASEGAPVVVPCDEMGVCPQYRDLAQDIRGLPAYFFGIRPWLRRKLCQAYGCHPALDDGDAAVDASFEQVQIAEERLRTADKMFQAIEQSLQGFPEIRENLNGPRALLEEARNAYADALARYHRMWLSARGIRTTAPSRSRG